MTDYRPVTGAAYERYERAISRRAILRLTWEDESGVGHIGRVRPLDLQTRGGEEFLLVEGTGGRRDCIRLDRIADAAELFPASTPD